MITNNFLFQTLLVKNKESFKNLPPVQGMLSYREDNEKLYVKKGSKWDEIGSEKEVSVFLKIHLPADAVSSVIWKQHENRCKPNPILGSFKRRKKIWNEVGPHEKTNKLQ